MKDQMTTGKLIFILFVAIVALATICFVQSSMVEEAYVHVGKSFWAAIDGRN